MHDFMEEFKELNSLAERQRDKKARLKGSLDIVSKKLKEKGMKSPKEVRERLKNMKKKLVMLQKDFAKKTTDLKEKYSEHLPKNNK